MSTLRVTGLKQETSTATNISLAVGGGVTVAGISTFHNDAVFSNDVTVTGNMNIGGVLTYEDVTSIDSVGIITARSGIDVGTGTSISSPSSNVLALGTNSEERLRITSGGGVLIGGHTSAVDVGNAPNIEIVNTSTSTLTLARNDTSISSGNDIAAIRVWGNDSNGTYQQCAEILAEADGDHGTDDKPTALAFKVTADGGSSPTERLRLNSDGKLILSSTQRTTPFISGDGGMCIEQSYDGNLRALTIRNKDTDAAAATSMCFSLNRSGGDYDFISGQIKSEKEQSWTLSDSTIDSSMVFSTTKDNTLTERLHITSDGLIWSKASTSGSENATKGFYHGYSNPSTQTTGMTMKCLGIGGGSGPFDTGVSVNAGNAGGVALLFATRNTGAGTATDGAVYLAQFYYNGNNTPLIVHLGGDNWVTWGQTAGNNLQASWSGLSNYTFAMVMVQ